MLDPGQSRWVGGTMRRAAEVFVLTAALALSVGVGVAEICCSATTSAELAPASSSADRTASAGQRGLALMTKLDRRAPQSFQGRVVHEDLLQPELHYRHSLF